MGAHFDNFEIKSIENAGHWIHAEKREEFFGMSLKYLKS